MADDSVLVDDDSSAVCDPGLLEIEAVSLASSEGISWLQVGVQSRG